MILFWLASAALIGLALLFLLPPLLRERTLSAPTRDLNVGLARERLRELEREAAEGTLDPAQLEVAREELSRELLQEVGQDDDDPAPLRGRRELFTVASVSLALPLLAFALYLNLGDRGAVDGVPAAPQTGAATELPAVEDMVARLEQRLAQTPEDVNGWLMLGRSYSVMQRFADAERAFARTLELAPDNADVLVEYAATLARTRQGRFDGQLLALLERAIELAPEHLNARFLLGHAQLQAGRPAQALALWEGVAAALAPGSEDHQQLQADIARVRQQLGMPMPAATASASSETPVAVKGGGKSIEVRVALDPALAPSVEPGDTVFVYARATEGPRMPLAIVRRPASALPMTVTLDESMAMMANLTLASFPQVTVEARVSRTGNAMPQSGDLRGTRSPVSPGSGQPVDIVIDSRVP